MSSSLCEVRDCLKCGKNLTLLDSSGKPTEDINEASSVCFDPEDKSFALDEPTEFEIEGKKAPLKAIIQCWLHKDSNAAEYLADCQEKNLINISFLQRTVLLNWLSGSSDSLHSSGIVGDESAQEKSDRSKLDEKSKSANGSSGAANQLKDETLPAGDIDPVVKEALSHERVLLDHNSSLRGSKPINFSYLIKDSELKLVQSLKSSLRSKSSSQKSSQARISKNGEPSQHAPRKDPIILIPSAASSIFTIANIKQFLEDAQYINPRDLPVSQTDLVTVEKKFDRLSRPLRFIIVNNTRMFTKPEYWDRVVAVFTMGHKWQFNNYQWNTPQELFQHCKGYYFHFSGDAVPHHVQQWNVQQVQLDKNIRFKDVEVTRFFWNSLERELIARRYH